MSTVFPGVSSQQHASLRSRVWIALAGATLGCWSMWSFAETGLGVDSGRSTALTPLLGIADEGLDPRGSSWLRPTARRSPSGNLYQCPARSAETPDSADWNFSGVLRVGGVVNSGDEDNALRQRYVHWDSGLILGLLDISVVRPADGSYAQFRASRINEDDQYYQAVFGRAGAYKVQAFLRESPNILSDNAKSIWNGVGSNRLTLIDGLAPGASSPAQVAAASAAASNRMLSIRREKQGVEFNAYLSPQWTVFANVSDEQRRGERVFGGPFYFNYSASADGGVLETIKPVADSTINLKGGLRYAGNTWRAEFRYAGSFYRDRYTRFDYESPFSLYPFLPNAASAPVFQGQFAMEPDNNYHNLQASVTRRLPANGELSLTAGAGRMSQNDTLIAPVNCQGVFGVDANGSGQPEPDNPLLYSCANWNTPDSLSRRTADLRIDTSLIRAHVVLRPVDALSLRGDLSFNREDYRSTYLALNPLTGQYGYVTENGSQGSINPAAPSGAGFWDANLNPSVVTRIRSIPIDKQTTDLSLGGEWHVSKANALDLDMDFQRYEPTHRERSQLDDLRSKLTWINRSLDGLTLRSSYSHSSRSGDAYDYDPYVFAYSTSLPGYVVPPDGTPAYTVDAMRVYDLADRIQNKYTFTATVAPRHDMTVNATVRAERNGYAAVLGRQHSDTTGATLQWEWQPSPSTSASAYLGYDTSELVLANIGDQDAGSDPSLGGAAYPDDGRWWARDEQRTRSAGASFFHDFGKLRFDTHWNYLRARGTTRYQFVTASALAYFPDGTRVPGNEFPPLKYAVNSLSVGVSMPLGSRFALRIFDNVERGRVSDWHYLGFDANRVYDHRVYADGGPQSYNANLLGMLLSIAL
ncbi:MAG: MtrB/PioB family outer membrane beta-barrel protein [Tahibacter sp.]